MVSQPARYAAGGGNDVDVDVAVVLAAEGNLSPVRREVRAEFASHASCQTSRIASLPAYDPKIVRILEYDLALAHRGVLKQEPFIALRREWKSCNGNQCKESADDFRHSN